MASTAQHIGSALGINNSVFHFEGNDLTEFLLGSIACDAPKIKSSKKTETKSTEIEIVETPSTISRKQGRSYSHVLPGTIVKENQNKFISPETTLEYGYQPVNDSPDAKIDYNQFRPMVNYFYEKNKNYMNEPFMLGYLTHLIADDIYFGEIVPTLVQKSEKDILEYINNKYDKNIYTKKDYLTNGEYLDWSHDALYKVFDDYSYLALAETHEVFPDLEELAHYCENWEQSTRDFKPSLIKGLSEPEAIIKFLKNPRISELINDAKRQFKEGNIIDRKGLTVNGLWGYKMYLDFIDKIEDNLEKYISKQNQK